MKKRRKVYRKKKKLRCKRKKINEINTKGKWMLGTISRKTNEKNKKN